MKLYFYSFEKEAYDLLDFTHIDTNLYKQYNTFPDQVTISNHIAVFTLIQQLLSNSEIFLTFKYLSIILLQKR